jgi:hypothetical protein
MRVPLMFSMASEGGIVPYQESNGSHNISQRVLITVPHINSSEMLVSHNVFSGDQYGVYLDATFEGGARCQVVSNDFQNIASTGIYLGPGTSHCIVAGNSNTTIQNLGTDNVIVNKGSAP